MDNTATLVVCGTVLMTVSACSVTNSTAARVEDRETMLAACNAQQGIGWLKKRYGDG